MRISDWSSDVCSSDLTDDKLLVSGTVGLNYYDLIDDSRFNASLLASKRWKTGIGDIGILVDVSTFEGAFRSDDITIEPYFDRSDIPGSEGTRSEEQTSELQSLMRISYAVFCLQKQPSIRQINT